MDGQPHPGYHPTMHALGTILVIDDDPDVVEAAQLALASHAARVDGATSLDGLAASVETTPYDCVLLDMNFAAGRRGGAEGLEALAVLKAADPTLAIVLMTAYGTVSLAVHGLKLGASDFLLKPWRNDALVAAVRSAAARTHAARAPVTLDSMERATIERALDVSAGNVAQAAVSLGLSRPALYRRMAKHGL